MIKLCAYPGRATATERPSTTDGWTRFKNLASGLPDGFYCPAHSAAIEAIISEGGFEDPENDLPPPAA